jgi:hypothetical protein
VSSGTSGCDRFGPPGSGYWVAGRGSTPRRINGSDEVVDAARRRQAGPPQDDTIQRPSDDVDPPRRHGAAEALQAFARLLAVHETAGEMVGCPALVLAGSDARTAVRARKVEEDHAG